jgi:hypothetical protein
MHTKLIFLFTTVKLTPFTVIEPFQWLDCLEIHHIQSVKPAPVVSCMQVPVWST